MSGIIQAGHRFFDGVVLIDPATGFPSTGGGGTGGGLTDEQLRASAVDIEPAYAPSGRAAVTGTFTAIGNSAAFTPIAGRSFNVTRHGSGTASVRLTRSFDGGGSWFPITANGIPVMTFTAPFSEQWSDEEAGVQYRLECTAFSSGPVTFRISQ